MILAVHFKSKNPADLEVGQIRSLLLLDNLTMVRLLTAPFRSDVKVSDEEIFSAWEYAVSRARIVLDVDLIGPNDVAELRNILFQLLAKEFPYAGN